MKFWMKSLLISVFADGGVEGIAGRRELRGKRYHFLDGHGLIHAAHGQRDREVLCTAARRVDAGAARATSKKAWRGYFDGVFAGGQKRPR